MAPHLILFVPNFGAVDQGRWHHLLETADLAEEAGVDGLAVSDHVVLGNRLDAHGDPAKGGEAGSHLSTGPDGRWLEPLTLLSVIAGRTSTIRLTTHVLLAALRRPVVLAKTSATLDVLSGGRFDLGVGIGWQQEEYAAAGLEFERRGALLDETLELCRSLWAPGPVSADIGPAHLAHVHSEPSPTRPTGVPIWVGGSLKPPVLRRITRHGAGWITWGPDAAHLDTAIPRLRSALEDAGRDPDTVGIRTFLPTSDGHFTTSANSRRRTRDLAATGVTHFVASLSIPPAASPTAQQIRDLVDAFRNATT